MITTYDEAHEWISGAINGRGRIAEPHLLLGNGFSISYDAARFSYGALLQKAFNDNLIGPIAQRWFKERGTQDFEQVIKEMNAAVTALRLLDALEFKDAILEIQKEVDLLKEALALVLSGLHPERPSDISDQVYARARRFLDAYKRIYTANYDLLLYWSLMQDVEAEGLALRRSDDGFRDPGYESEYVVWDHLAPHTQNVYYLHGALHLFRADDELRKITWIRTGDALIDQIRKSLNSGFFPLYVAEGESAEKLQRIQSSDYLARGLRSIAGLTGGMMCFGLSFSDNDAHIMEAIVRSKISRLAVSIYGDPTSTQNQETMKAVNRLRADRASIGSRTLLEVKYYSATTLSLW